MADPITPVLTKRWLSPNSWQIGQYEALEGYTAVRKALAGTPEQLVQLVKDSGLRGRGGPRASRAAPSPRRRCTRPRLRGR